MGNIFYMSSLGAFAGMVFVASRFGNLDSFRVEIDFQLPRVPGTERPLRPNTLTVYIRQTHNVACLSLGVVCSLNKAGSTLPVFFFSFYHLPLFARDEVRTAVSARLFSSVNSVQVHSSILYFLYVKSGQFWTG